jgi:uncharacterized membrane protein
MDLLMVVLRFFHIVAGALWFGSAFLFAGFVGPSAAEVGPSAGPLMSAVVKKRRAARVITGLSLSTVIAGWLMWLVDLSRYGSLGDWLGSTFGIVITIGAVLATIAAYLGVTGIGMNVEKLVELGDAVRAAGGPPTPEQGARLEHLGAEIARHGKIDLVLLFIAVSAMATARYW